MNKYLICLCFLFFITSSVAGAQTTETFQDEYPIAPQNYDEFAGKEQISFSSPGQKRFTSKLVKKKKNKIAKKKLKRLKKHKRRPASKKKQIRRPASKKKYKVKRRKNRK